MQKELFMNFKERVLTNLRYSTRANISDYVGFLCIFKC